MCNDTEGSWKFKGKLTRGLKNDIWLIFMLAVESLETFHFHWILLSKAYKVLDEKLQKSYIS